MSTPQQPPEPTPREPARNDPGEWTGRTVVDRDGSRLGELEHVYLDRGSNSPTWGVVKAGRKHQFVPLQDADSRGDSVHVPASKQQVRSAPSVSADEELPPESESRLAEHYSMAGSHQGPEKRSPMEVRRSRGALSGAVLVPLGVWTAIIPFIGPYFGYGLGVTQPWTFTWDMLWLSILPGLAILLGGLMLGPTGNRAVGSLASWLALAGGGWLIVGPSLSQLWGPGGPASPYGIYTGPEWIQVLAQLGYFFAVGALVTTLAAMAFGRMAVRSVKD